MTIKPIRICLAASMALGTLTLGAACAEPEPLTGPDPLDELDDAFVADDDQHIEDQLPPNVDQGFGYIEKDGVRSYFSELRDVEDFAGCGPEMTDILGIYVSDGAEHQIHVDLYPGWFETYPAERVEAELPGDEVSAGATICTARCDAEPPFDNDADAPAIDYLGAAVGSVTLSSVDGWAFSEVLDLELKFSPEEGADYVVVMPSMPLPSYQ